MQFCVEFQRGHLATEAFMKALIEQDLLIPYQVTSTLESGERLSATGFKVIDEARFAKLPDDVVVNLVPARLARICLRPSRLCRVLGAARQRSNG